MPGNEVERVIQGTVTGSRQAGWAEPSVGRDLAQSAGKASKWVGHNVNTARQIGGAGNPGLMRLLDVHAAASAGDTLVVIGLLKAIFFVTPVADARARVALFLVVTMVPFAILAPLLGPLLDRFRHGRRLALSLTLLSRAVLVWIISFAVDGGLWLYVGAFGVVLLSRVYGVARSAALARLVPPSGLRLSQASARAAVFATITGAVAAAIGGFAAWIGPQWPLRLGGLVFFVGAIIAANLPRLADSEGPEVLPQPLGLPWRGPARPADGSLLNGQSIGVAVLGSAGLRLLFGFLLVFLAFAIRSSSVGGGPFGVIAGPIVQLTMVGSAFGLGTLIATTIGTALRVIRPMVLQASGLTMVALSAIYASVRFGMTSVLLLCLCTAVASGLAKVAVDAAIQERIPERDRPDAFARTETLLMLTWLAGAAIGLVPGVPVRLGVGVATIVGFAAIAGTVAATWRPRRPAAAGPVPATGSDAMTGVLVHPGYGPSTPATPPAAEPEAPAGYHVFKPSPPMLPEAPMSPPATATDGG
jgi:MFS family permease